MKISTKGRYALRMMLDLATHQGDGYVALKDIAQRQEISKKYLEQIVATLNKAALVKSIRGSHGGYMLSEPPRNYTVGRILRTMEGNLSPTDCVGANGWPCENKATCVSLIIWQKLDEAINGVLEGMTLEDLVEWQQNLWTDQYVIGQQNLWTDQYVIWQIRSSITTNRKSLTHCEKGMKDCYGEKAVFRCERK